MTPEQIEVKAKEAVGNWMSFPDFSWDLSDRPEDAEDWCIIHTRTRDSDAMERANARVIEKALKPFEDATPKTAHITRFMHWACGWVDAVAIKVYDADGKPTKAFRKVCEMNEKREHYPALDDEIWEEEQQKDEE